MKISLYYSGIDQFVIEGHLNLNCIKDIFWPFERLLYFLKLKPLNFSLDRYDNMN